MYAFGNDDIHYKWLCCRLAGRMISLSVHKISDSDQFPVFRFYCVCGGFYETGKSIGKHKKFLRYDNFEPIKCLTKCFSLGLAAITT